MIALLCAAVAGGWRMDGSGQAPAAAAWDREAWTASVGSPGNGSPVVLGGAVFVTAEPDRLVALDLATGQERWDRANPVIGVLDPALAESVRPLVEHAPELRAERTATQRRLATLLREARRAESVSISADIDAVERRLAEIDRLLAAVAPYDTPGTQDVIGYASPTPATDGEAVYVLFATGVVARFQPDGSRRWARWLGPLPRDLRGYDGTATASPQVVGDLLVVPYGALSGLDLDTGATRWRGPEYNHFGTPAVGRVGSRWLLYTPDGLAVDARDGRVVARDLGSLYYTGPTANGDRVYYVGTDTEYTTDAANHAVGWRLADAGEVVATPLFRVELPTRDRVYSVPVVLGDRLFMMTRHKALLVLDAVTGAVVHKETVSESVGEVWAPLTASGGRVYAPCVCGEVYELQDAPPFARVATRLVGEGMGAPWLLPGGALWRTRVGVARWVR